jgi:hypothetical protein
MSIENLIKLNVNEHLEKKNGLSYLSWAWAWAEALKADPQATYKIEMYDEYGDNGRRRTVPYLNINGTCMVFVTVTMFGKQMTCQLPVIDYKNKAIADPDAFAVNTAIMRCMTKGLALHGLGLYIYAGEDLPQEPKVTPRANAGALVPDDEKEFLKEMAEQITALVTYGDSVGALNMVRAAGLEAEQHTYLWDQLDSKVRSAIKKAKEL